VAGRTAGKGLHTMVRKRAIHGAIVLTLALGLFSAPVMAADSPERAQATLWSGIEAWFQDLVAGWLGPETIEATHQADEWTPAVCSGPPGVQDGGSGGPSTTDGGSDSDPNG